MSKADLNKQPEAVAAMFDEVAQGYDRTNTILSAGNDRLWRIATTRALDPAPGEKVLDLAAGTGTSSAAFARRGASVTAADFSPGMLAVGKKIHADNARIEFVQADGMDLPFADDEFDAVTISFGLRNIVDPKKALSELYRVTKPGGRIVICEFSHPPTAVVSAGYFAYLKYGAPLITSVVSSNAPAYSYLEKSILDWPKQQVLASWMRDTGFERVAYRDLTFGIVALHRGIKPLAAASSKKAASSENAAASSKKAAASENAAAPSKKKTAASDTATVAS